MLWGVGLAVVALLVGGGAFAVTQLASSPSAAPAGPTGQAAQLNNILNAASSPSSAAAATAFDQTDAASPAPAPTPCQARSSKLRANGHPAAAQRELRLCRQALARLRRVGGLHGQYTFTTKKGTTTLAYERGVIQSVSGSDVVVKASDGTTWTWLLQADTVIRRSGAVTPASALSAGEHVWAGGPVASGTYQVRLIVILPATGSSPTGS